MSGFLEPGETIEEAVTREIYEEVGVRVSDVQYVKSQPWPLPRGAVAGQLMLGCIASVEDASKSEIKVDYDEIDDARWFTAEQVRQGLARATGSQLPLEDTMSTTQEDAPLLLPPPLAIAHELAHIWAATQPP